MALKKRSIFEDVGQGAKAPVPQGGSIDRGHGGARRGLRLWLALVFLLVLAGIMLGDLLRASGQSLSIPDLRLEGGALTGLLPPLDAAAWQAEFARHQASADAALRPPGLTLAGFQWLYGWEWGQRQLGRLAVVVFALGLSGFLAARKIPRGWGLRLLALGGLVVAQAAAGWWVTASDAVYAQTSLAGERLALSLGLGFAALGTIAWQALQLGRSEADLLQSRRQRDGGLFTLSTVLLGVTLVQILLGALVAGTDMGRAFATWPDMNGTFLPPHLAEVPGTGGPQDPAFWLGLLHSPALVQFAHRLTGVALVMLTLAVWGVSRRSAHRATRGAFDLVLLALVAEAGLGIGTILSSAEWRTALAHLAGSVVAWVLILHARHLAQHPRVGSIRKGTL